MLQRLLTSGRKQLQVCYLHILLLCLPTSGLGDILFYPVRLSVHLSDCPSQNVSTLVYAASTILAESF